MRNYVASLAGEKAGEVGKLAQRVVLNNNTYTNDFWKHTKDHPTMHDALGNPMAYFIFNDYELNKWCGRIIKGLYFKRTRQRLSENARCEVISLGTNNPPSSLDFPMQEGLEFRPFFIYLENSLENHVQEWILLFYERIGFQVFVDMADP